jgi:hypothetical protein
VSYWQSTPIYLQCTPNRLPLADLSHCTCKCLRRKLDLNDAVEWKVAKFYVLVLLSRVAGNKGWSDRERLHTTISRAIAPYDERKKLFHVSQEAFVAYLWDNNQTRWTLQLQWLYENPDKPNIPLRNETNKDEPMYKGKYSSQNMGQTRYGGHRMTGIERYNQLFQMVVNAKYKDPKKMNDDDLNEDWVKWEEDFLDKIRTEMGLHADPGANANDRRRRRRDGAAAVPEVAVMGIDFDM